MNREQFNTLRNEFIQRQRADIDKDEADRRLRVYQSRRDVLTRELLEQIRRDFNLFWGIDHEQKEGQEKG